MKDTPTDIYVRHIHNNLCTIGLVTSLHLLLFMSFVVAFAFINFGCTKHEDTPTQDPDPTVWEVVNDKYDYYKDNTTPDIFTRRCDNLTFYSLSGAFNYGLGAIDLGALEYSPGEWHRDRNPCYPEESKSECSRDGFIMLFHYLWTTRDYLNMSEIYQYGYNSGWNMCDGPTNLVNLLPLVPTLTAMINSQTEPSGTSEQLPFGFRFPNGQATEIPNPLEGFRGHLLALYIHLQGRIHGELNDLEYAAMKTLLDANPDNPLFLAIYHRYTDGDQTLAIQGLADETVYPKRVIIEESPSAWGWGSCPTIVHYIATMGVINGL